MERGVTDADRDEAVLAAVRMAVRRYGIVPATTAAAELVTTDGQASGCS